MNGAPHDRPTIGAFRRDSSIEAHVEREMMPRLQSAFELLDAVCSDPDVAPAVSIALFFLDRAIDAWPQRPF